MNKSKFFEEVKKSLFGGKLTQTQVNGLEAIIDEWNRQGGGQREQLAYVLATPYHEVGRAYKPIRENLNYKSAAQIRKVWPSRFKTDADASPFVGNAKKLAIKVYGGRLGNKPAPSSDGYDFRGGGWEQRTGRVNFERIGIADNPNKILEPSFAAKSIVVGMRSGEYTGKKLSDFINNAKTDYGMARTIINADRTRKTSTGTIGSDIAGYAAKFDAALKAAGYSSVVPVTKPEIPPILKPTIPVQNKPEPTKAKPNWLFIGIAAILIALGAIIFI